MSKQYVCKICGKEHENGASLGGHLSTIHPEHRAKHPKTGYPKHEKRMKCTICGQKYYSAKWFAVHMMWHEKHPGERWVAYNPKLKKSINVAKSDAVVVPSTSASMPTQMSDNVARHTIPLPHTVDPEYERVLERLTAPPKCDGKPGDAISLSNVCTKCNKQFESTYKMHYCPDCGAGLTTIKYVKVKLS